MSAVSVAWMDWRPLVWLLLLVALRAGKYDHQTTKDVHEINKQVDAMPGNITIMMLIDVTNHHKALLITSYDNNCIVIININWIHSITLCGSKWFHYVCNRLYHSSWLCCTAVTMLYSSNWLYYTAVVSTVTVLFTRWNRHHHVGASQ